MTASRSPFRRAIVALIALSLGASGAVAVSSTATAAPGQPIMIVGSIFGTTTGGTTVNAIVEDGLDQTVTVWFLPPGVTDQAERVFFCDFFVAASGANSGNCSGAFTPGVLGEYTLFVTANDGTGESVPSDSRVFPVGESASSVPVTVGGDLGTGVQQVQESLLVTVEGEAPVMSRVVVSATSVSPAVATNLCIIERVPVSGTYECLATLPSPRYGQWTISVQARDVAASPVTIDALGGPFSIVVPAPEPAVDAITAPAAASFTVTGEPTSNVGGELLLNGFGTPTSAGYCPAGWSGSPLAPPTAGTSIPCDFSALPAGIHIFESGQFINGTATLGREDALYIPATPTLTVEPVPGGAIFRGTVDPLVEQLTVAGARLDALEVVVRDAADQVVCDAEADLTTGDWACGAPLEPGADSFSVAARAVGFGFNPDAFGEVDGYIGGTSAPTMPVAATIPAATGVPTPVMTYGLGAASIDVRAEGLPDSAIELTLYRVIAPPDEEYQYEVVGSCGLPSADDGDGEGAAVGMLPPTAPSVIDDCVLTGLEPGIWNIYGLQYFYYDRSEYIDHYVMIPAAPTMVATPSGPGQLVASGTGDPGYRVQVQQLGGAATCATTVTTAGTWSCALGGLAGEVLLRAQQQSEGFVATPPIYFGLAESYDGFSAWTAPFAVTVAAPPLLPAAPGPLVWTLEGYDGSPLTPGQQLSLRARGLPVDTEVVIEIRSTPQVLGSALADPLGVFSLDVTVPTDIPPGEHTLVGIATPPGGVPSSIEIPVTIVALDVAVDGTAEPLADEPSPAAGGSGGGSAVDRSDPASPSAISDSIPTLARLLGNPLAIATGGGLALALLLLVAFPAELLNNTIASNSRRIGRWYAALDDRLERFTEWFARVTRSRAVAAALLVVLTAVTFGFVDPDYGFDPVSLRMTASLALGLFVITYVASWISGRIVQRVWSIPCRVGLQPAALLFAVVGVVIARLLEFSPGFLIGLVIGLDVLARVGAPYRVKALVTNLAVTVGLALAGWVGYSVLAAFATGEQTWGQLLLSDALVATAAEGLTAALASLLPLGFLAGHEIAKQSRWLWIACFAVVATLFAVIVLPTADGETEGIDVAFWLLVMVIFAVVTLTLWALLRFTATDDDAEGENAEPEPLATAR